MAAPNVEQASPPRHFSRYRSVRKAHAQAHDITHKSQTPPMPPMPSISAKRQQQEPTVSRSMSRYHRRPTVSHTSPPCSVTTSPTAKVTPPPRNRTVSSPQAHVANQAQSSNASTSRVRADTITKVARPKTARDEAKQLLQNEAERHKRMKEEMRARQKVEQEEREHEEIRRKEQEEAARVQADEAARIKAEEATRAKAEKAAAEAEKVRKLREEKEHGRRLQKAENAKRVQEREEAERVARAGELARRAQTVKPVSPPKSSGAFALFKRHKEDALASPRGSKTALTVKEDRDMDNIRVGGGGAVLGIDAPISAVNTEGRRVSVVCNSRSFQLPVTPETTAEDLLRSAATCMTEPINTKTDMLVECFLKVNVTRPVRMYERIRDIMNSWDHDAQNDLVIVNSDLSQCDHGALLASTVPDDKPTGYANYMSYSCRPGKWNKRYISLRTDGQLVMSKTESAKEHDIICHLSDFDVYAPTKAKKKKISPPKKNCYAVKSQQKSNIYSDESRYVHFFSITDDARARAFYEALQQWRSWHLKHVMGEGQKKPKDDGINKGVAASSSAMGTAGAASQPGAVAAMHARNGSNSSYYQLGSFKPFFDFDQVTKDVEAAGQAAFQAAKEDLQTKEDMQTKEDTHTMHARKMSTRVKNPPPPAFGRGLVHDVPSQPVEKPSALPPASEEAPFTSNSLLGRQYSQRRRAAQERENHASTSVNDPSGLHRKSSVRSATRGTTSSDLQRNPSTHHRKPQPPKPLIDLTPQYREPPQFRNKGKGFTPDAASAGVPLVENATSMEEAIQVPSAVDWRARPLDALASTNATTALTTAAPPNTDPPDSAFTGSGLLARVPNSTGARQPMGRGVMDGSKAKGPMLDLAGEAQFRQGSLLAGVVGGATRKGE